MQLEDAKHQIVVSIVPSVGNTAYAMTVKGTNILRSPYPSLEAFKAKPTRHAGNPFLAPWANRLDELAFYANGKKYPFNMELGNVRGPRPIHGLVTYATQWKVIEARADTDSAWVTSRLEFWREPSWMAQFPFAHAIDMTYRLRDGVLEVATAIENLSSEPMPISVGYHPYFQLTDAPRDEWTVSVGARREWLLSPDKLPTGETRPIEQFFPNPAQVRLGDFDLDHVFDDLVRDANGRAVMSVRGKSQRIDVTFGPNYRAAVHLRAGVGQGIHLLRTDGRHQQRDESGAPRRLQGTADARARPDVARELLGSPLRLLKADCHNSTCCPVFTRQREGAA